MLKKIIFNVSAKDEVIADCVKLLPAKNYTDTIQKDFDYTGQNYITVTYKNFCQKSFNVPEITLFTDTTNGGDFTAKTGSFSINPMQEIQKQVKYFGMYKGAKLNPVYPISLNGISATYSLIITVPEVNTPPVTSDVIIEIDNRDSYTFKIEDFINHFSDVDGDDLSAVIITGDTSLYEYKGSTLVSGTEIPKIDIINNQLKIKSQNTNDFIDNGVLWNAVDSRGAISS